jgi:hypothetical protein
MAKLHVVLVCHTELHFDGSWDLYERIQAQMDALFLNVAEATRKRPKVTYCVTGDFLSERLEDAFRFLEGGHEIGIHSHLPGAHRPSHRYDGHYAYRLDDDGVLNQDSVAGPLRQMAIALGLPAPATHVSGMFTFQQTTIRVVEEAGFTVDCSLLPGVEKGKHPATGDFILADNARRKEPYPYRPAREDPWADGDSSIIELPVSGNLGGGGSLTEDIASLQRRLEGNREVDVFQTCWHHYEFANPPRAKSALVDAEAFLLACARSEKVVFSTGAEAAEDLRRHGL